MDTTVERGRKRSIHEDPLSKERNHSKSSSSSSSSSSLSDSIPSWLLPVVSYLSVHVAWIPPNFVWSKLKPVIRCALVAWVSLILFVIPEVQVVMGQASFLILIAMILSPPSDPFLSVLERELLILTFASISWAWCCLGIFLSSLARRVHDPTATIFDVVDGRYIEAVPSIIIGIFIFFGSATLVGLKAKLGPGPYLFPCVLSCLVINISLTTAALFPFPFYLIGRTILVPLSIHTGLALLGSILIFPSTISALFTTRLQDTLSPGVDTLTSHITLLSTPLTSPFFPSELATLRANTKKCETTLVPLAGARRLLDNDIIFGRFAPGDFVAFQGMLRRFAGRADGLSVFFSLVDPGREKFPGTMPQTAVNTPVGTPRVGLSRATSRAPSLEREDVGEGIQLSPISTSKRSIPSSPTHKTSYSIPHSHFNLHLVQSSTSAPVLSPSHSQSYSLPQATSMPIATVDSNTSNVRGHQHHHHPHHHHHHLLHSSLLSLARAHAKKPEYAVGTFESQRYLNLEATTLWDPYEEMWNVKVGGLLKESCVPLLEACSVGITSVKDWLSTVRDTRLAEFFSSPSTSSPTPSNIDEKTSTPPHADSNANSPSNSNLNSNSIPSSGSAKVFRWFGLGPHLRAIESRRKREERMKKIKEVREEVAKVLDEFRRVGRHAVLEPYKHVFDTESDADRPNQANDSPMRDYVPLDVDDDKETRSPGAADAQEEADQDEIRGLNKEKEKRSDSHPQTPAHRYLFNCFVFQYNLLQIASIVLEMLDEIIRLEELRTHCRLWTPAERFFNWSSWLIADNIEDDGDDDDPDVIQGLSHGMHDSSDLACAQPAPINNPKTKTNPPSSTRDNKNDNIPTSPTLAMPSQHTGPAFDPSTTPSGPLLGSPFPHDPNDLGLPKRRDPDALPPRNVVEWFMVHSYKFFVGLGSNGMLFSIKAGLLTVALSLPSLIKSSAEFAYENKFIWGVFMGQLTISRFRGDTVFGFTARIISTFFGAIAGMVMWYISCGSGNGNAYGLAAVCAVCFPMMFFGRIYWPIPPMRNIVFFVTIILVIGYSYQDTHQKSPGIPGTGWSVAWKRFVLVAAGVTAAFIASFFPPTTTIRMYQRRLLATTSSELGMIYCSILSFANTKHEPEIQEIIASLIAVRNKLNKSAVMVNNVQYEFSFHGRWPADRYRKIAELQVGISYALSHLMSVLEHIDPSWARAFLRRTRFMDPGFQGDVLAVISMISSSLRTGNPLPQITPCPLIDRFMLKYHGLNVIHKDAEEDYGLPRTLSMDTLRDEQYLMFSVGISTAFGIINRLDRLMIAVKEIVGEQYHIHGVGFARAQMPSDGRPATGNGGTGTNGGDRGVAPVPVTNTNTVHFEPPV